jgi:hypothetical protein
MTQVKRARVQRIIHSQFASGAPLLILAGVRGHASGSLLTRVLTRRCGAGSVDRHDPSCTPRSLCHHTRPSPCVHRRRIDGGRASSLRPKPDGPRAHRAHPLQSRTRGGYRLRYAHRFHLGGAGVHDDSRQASGKRRVVGAERGERRDTTPPLQQQWTKVANRDTWVWHGAEHGLNDGQIQNPSNPFGILPLSNFVPRVLNLSIIQ